MTELSKEAKEWIELINSDNISTMQKDKCIICDSKEMYDERFCYDCAKVHYL